MPNMEPEISFEDFRSHLFRVLYEDDNTKLERLMRTHPVMWGIASENGFEELKKTSDEKVKGGLAYTLYKMHEVDPLGVSCGGEEELQKIVPGNKTEWRECLLSRFRVKKVTMSVQEFLSIVKPAQEKRNIAAISDLINRVPNLSTSYVKEMSERIVKQKISPKGDMISITVN